MVVVEGLSPGQIARQGRRRGRIRDPRHPDLRHCRRAAGRAGHPHDHYPPRTGHDVHGRRLCARVGKAGGSAGGAGLYNAAAGLTNAYSRSTPVLLVAGQIRRGAIGKNLGAVHDIANQPDAVRSVTKWQRLALRPREIPDAVSEAFRQMRTGRPRPVLLEIPPDAGVEQEEVELRNPARISRIVPKPGRPEGSRQDHRRV